MQFKQLCLSLYVAMIVMTTVAFICRKIIGGQCLSGQAIKLFQAPRKIVLPSFFTYFFMMWNLQSYPTTVSDIIWHFRGQNILWPLQHIFRRSGPLKPIIYAPGWQYKVRVLQHVFLHVKWRKQSWVSKDLRGISESFSSITGYTQLIK